MRATKLILLEGIPGSGKSTTGQFLAEQIGRRGIPVRWWYEEEPGVPLYVFDDVASMQRVVDDLFAGRYQPVLAAALEKWGALAESLAASDGVVVLDSCFFGYLTWTLFQFDAPVEEIPAYLAAVEAIIGPIAPTLVHLVHHDVAGILRHVCDHRGQKWEQEAIRKAVSCPRGKRQGLEGFAGLVQLWSDYQDVAEQLAPSVGFPKLRLDDPSRDWRAARRATLEFLDLPAADERVIDVAELTRLAGTYATTDRGIERQARIVLEDGDLVAYDLPGLWPRNRLVPRSPSVFAVESYPAEIVFQAGWDGTVTGMRLSGRKLLDAAPNHVFRRA